MGSLADLSTVEVMDQVLGRGAVGHRDVASQLALVHDAAWAATDGRRLELCRLRVAMLLGCPAEAAAATPGHAVDPETVAALAAWPSDPRFDAGDRACLALTEAYVIDVASVDDETVDAVRFHLGDAGTASFVNALLAVEQRIRLRLAWDRLFGGN
jgi:hypothetical protein